MNKKIDYYERCDSTILWISSRMNSAFKSGIGLDLNIIKSDALKNGLLIRKAMEYIGYEIKKGTWEMDNENDFIIPVKKVKNEEINEA